MQENFEKFKFCDVSSATLLLLLLLMMMMIEARVHDKCAATPTAEKMQSHCNLPRSKIAARKEYVSLNYFFSSS